MKAVTSGNAGRGLLCAWRRAADVTAGATSSGAREACETRHSRPDPAHAPRGAPSSSIVVTAAAPTIVQVLSWDEVDENWAVLDLETLELS